MSGRPQQVEAAKSQTQIDPESYNGLPAVDWGRERRKLT